MPAGGHNGGKPDNLADMSLPELLRTLKAQGISARQIAANAEHDPLRQTISALMNGTHSGDIRRTTLDLIAAGVKPYGYTRKEVYSAAIGEDPPQPFRLPDQADYLSLRQRQAIVSVVNAMLEGEHQERADVRPLRPELGLVPERAAARNRDKDAPPRGTQELGSK